MKGTFKIPGTFLGTFNLHIVVQVITLLHLLKKGKQRKWLKLSLVKLGYVMCQKATLYWNAQINQDMIVLFVWSKKAATSIK